MADRLATLDRVRLDVGAPGNMLPVEAIPAPIRGQLYFLILPNPEVEARLRQDGESVVVAEPKDRAWSIQSRGRLGLGRRASNDTRRSELAHWIPEGAQAANFLALPYYPETLDYQYDANHGRRRANGPIPGGERPPLWKALANVGGGPFWPWFLASGALQALGILVLAAPEHRNVFILLLVLACGMLPVIGAKLAFAPYDMDRWRMGLENDKAVAAIRTCGASEGALARSGHQVLLASALLWGLLGFAAGSVVSATAALLSGAPVILLFMAVRRRSSSPASEAG